MALRFDRLATGITVEPASAIAKNGESKAQFVLKAIDTVFLGDFTVKATRRRADATHDFKFTVAHK